MLIAIIFISSIGAANAYEIDENQTGAAYLGITSTADNSNQELLSASNSTEATSQSNDTQNSSGAYLVLDNDADKENVNVGDYVTWILEAINLGPDTAKNVKVYDKLPDGLKYIKHETEKGTFDPETSIWNIGDLTVDEESVTLYITTQALTVGEKINEAYITSDTLNLNNETYEQEEIDVLSSDDSEISEFVKHASAKMHETGNPIFLAMISIFLLSVPVIKR
ncbi:MAG: DUF11 domain-containing protein [Methanobrevibacter sp.]|uniref:DUF11 domain-containing protein n=1 Tax=Methanobrevibacter sp. TaxID=66852 RepID=UPI0025E98C92|nr:DUF11 domain-containing protein [Methanobrevibacter sp.]MBE6508382.1 DUF11 domain-containing protein [Methanobrevibacter sp.]